MKPTKEELMKAAGMLRDNCVSSDMCEGCPLNDTFGYCVFDGIPQWWKLEELK